MRGIASSCICAACGWQEPQASGHLDAPWNAVCRGLDWRTDCHNGRAAPAPRGAMSPSCTVSAAALPPFCKSLMGAHKGECPAPQEISQRMYRTSDGCRLCWGYIIMSASSGIIAGGSCPSRGPPVAIKCCASFTALWNAFDLSLFAYSWKSRSKGDICACGAWRMAGGPRGQSVGYSRSANMCKQHTPSSLIQPS